MDDQSTQDYKRRTITLTDRPPVTIRDGDWPLLASAQCTLNGESPRQASRERWIKVRQHNDGRTLVYGGYDTQWRDERSLRAGELLPKPEDERGNEDIVHAIHRVCKAIGGDRVFAQDCIADLPAEDLP